MAPHNVEILIDRQMRRWNLQQVSRKPRVQPPCVAVARLAHSRAAEIVIAYQGCVASEAIEAAGRIGEDRRDIGVLAITSADRLNAGWTAAQRARRRGQIGATSQVERLMSGLPPHCTLITVTDGHPATLAWLGSVAGYKTVPLGVEHFGQTGTIDDLYRHFSINADAIVTAAHGLAPGRPVRNLGQMV